MIIPVRIMLKSKEKIDSVDCKIFCNQVEYPYELVDHGQHFDIYENEDLFFQSIDTVFDCDTNNDMAIVWPTKPTIDSEIDDIEINYLYVDKPRLFSKTSFYHVYTDTLVPAPNEYGSDHWQSATWINNPGVFYLSFSLPIEQWCFNND